MAKQEGAAAAGKAEELIEVSADRGGIRLRADDVSPLEVAAFALFVGLCVFWLWARWLRKPKK